MNTLIEISDSYLARGLVAHALLMLLTWIVYLSLRNRSPSLRHRILFLGLLASLTLPVLIPITHNLRLTFLLVAQPDNEPQSNALALNDGQLKSDAQAEQNAAATVTENRLFELAGATQSVAQPIDLIATARAKQASKSAQTERTDHSPKRSTTQAPPAYRQPTFTSVVICAWLLVGIALLLQAAIEQIRLTLLIHRSILITDNLACSILQRVTNGYDRPIQLLCSSTIDVPFATGAIFPKIVLPAGYGRWSSDRLRVVLLHETAHIRRGDLFAQLIARLACFAYWFNPLVWIAGKQMHAQRELACDDTLITNGQNPTEYADHLIDIATEIRSHWRPPAFGTAMASGKNLKTRIGRIMGDELDRSEPSRRARRGLLATGFICLVVSVSFIPAFAQNQRPANSDATEFTLQGDLPADWFEQLQKMSHLETLTIDAPKANFKASELSQLKKLTELNVKNLSLRSRLADATLLHAAKIPGLKRVTFHRAGLTKTGTSSLANSIVEEVLLIGEELMTDDAYEPIGRMRNLQKLILDGTPIEAPGLSHLSKCPGLRTFELLKDRGATERLPVIAGFPKLKRLVLTDTRYDDLSVLDITKTLTDLELRRCGGKDLLQVIKNLPQLKQLSLDNCDVPSDAMSRLGQVMSRRGGLLRDTTRYAPVIQPATANEATRLARKVHRDLDVARNHPTFWVKWKTTWGEVPTMQLEPIRTTHRLMKALDEDSAPIETMKGYETTATMAWSPGQFFSRDYHTRYGKPESDSYKYGTADLAWAREWYSEQNYLTHFPRLGVKKFTDNLFYIPTQLKVSHQHFWWGPGANHQVATSPVDPELATYRELPDELFADEECHVVESSTRSERLWISKATGRLRGIQTFIHQGYFVPFYKQPIVTEVAGRPIESLSEYRTLFNDENALSQKDKNRLTAAWSEYKFDHAIPRSLHEFSDFREIASGKWFPFKVRSSGWHHSENNDQYYSFNNSEIVVAEVFTDRSDLKSYWEPLLPKEGESVQDQRFKTAVEYKYSKDRTDEEIQQMVQQRLLELDRGRKLLNERKGPIQKLVGKSAFDLPDERWIGERPKLKGKSYLLHFWAAWCAPCKNDIPLLNKIAKDRPVVGLHPSGTEIDKIRKSATESEMQYPTIVAPPGAKDIFGYPVTMYPYVIEIDENGKIARHGSLHDVLTAVAKPANATEVRPQVNGKVSFVNEKKGLAEVSVGTDDSVTIGDIFKVTRKEEAIGELEIIKLEQDQSLSKILPKNGKAPKILAGDQIERLNRKPAAKGPYER